MATINWLVLFRKMIAVYIDNLINSLIQNEELLTLSKWFI